MLIFGNILSQTIYYESNILWGNYFRPPWAGNITFAINEHSGQVFNAHGFVLPISSRGRGNIPLSYGALFTSNIDRGHLIGLSNGGPDIQQNVVAQPSDWQVNGGWAELQEIIHNVTVLSYGWTGCMCPDNNTYTAETVFNTPKPDSPVYLSITVYNWGPDLYPQNYSGFFYDGNGTKFKFNINKNERVKWVDGPKPPKHLACTHGGTPCCDRWNCCEQQQIEQVFANNMKILDGLGTVIYENDTMKSNNDLYQMKLESYGNLVIYSVRDMQAIWNSNTSDGLEYSPHKLVITSNGTMYLSNNYGQITIISCACGDIYNWNQPFRFIMENNGNLVLYDHSNDICWSSNTIVNASYNNKEYFICSSNALFNIPKDNISYFLSNDSCVAEVNNTGQFVIKDGNKVIWFTNTTNAALPPYRLSLQMDGKVVLYGNKQSMWQLNSSSHDFATMENWMLMLHRSTSKETCVLTFYDNQMRVIWSSL